MLLTEHECSYKKVLIEKSKEKWYNNLTELCLPFLVSIASFMDHVTEYDGPVVGQFPFQQTPQVGFQGQPQQPSWPQAGWYKSKIFGKRKQK